MVKTALTISMTAQRSPFDPRSFGRRRPFVGAVTATATAPAISDDLKLFALTYLAGFAVVFAYLA
jgi:hypothetical protein